MWIEATKRSFIKGSWEAILRVMDDFCIQVTLHHITIHHERWRIMKGGVRLYTTQQYILTGGVRPLITQPYKGSSLAA